MSINEIRKIAVTRYIIGDLFEVTLQSIPKVFKIVEITSEPIGYIFEDEKGNAGKYTEDWISRNDKFFRFLGHESDETIKVPRFEGNK